jgi:Ca2+-binding RTX toxin-like protein
MLDMTFAPVADGSFLTGDNSANLLTGTNLNDQLLGQGGNDNLMGMDGADWLDGGPRNDLLYGQAGDDKIFGGDGKDKLFGEDGNDILIGGNKNDKLDGGAGNDILYGGSGDDFLTGGSGQDIFVLTPGEGLDRIRDFSPGEDKIYLDGSLAFSNLELIAQGSDTLLRINNSGDPNNGTDLAELAGVSVSDLDSDDFMFITDTPAEVNTDSDAQDAAATTIPEAQNTAANTTLATQEDTPTSDADAALTDEGPMNASAAPATEGLTNASEPESNSNANSNDQPSDQGWTSNLTDTSGPDWINGGPANDQIYGQAGDDKISGGDGKDRLFGEGGNDILIGGNKNDKLDGGAGNDILDGGSGDDFLTGGSGQDTFVLTPGNGLDRLRDFSPGEDKIHIKADLTFADLEFIAQGADTLLRVNKNGDPNDGTDLAELAGVSVSDLDSDDFMFIGDTLTETDTASDTQDSDANTPPNAPNPETDTTADVQDDVPTPDEDTTLTDEGQTDTGEDHATGGHTEEHATGGHTDASEPDSTGGHMDGSMHGSTGGHMDGSMHDSTLDHTKMLMAGNGPSLDELAALSTEKKSGFRVRSTGNISAKGSKGLFRNMSDVSHFNYSDPLINFDDPNASTHLHMFWGNNFVDETFISDASTFNERALEVRELLLAQESSSAAGGTANLSSYWIPAIVDGNNEVQIPQHFHTYYKDGSFRSEVGPGESIDDLDTLSRTQINMIPNGLRMLAGNPRATSESEQSSHVSISYSRDGATVSSASNFKDAAANAKKGDMMEITLVFPQCWDGVNLDSPDHKSHMAYPVGRNKCPDSHPYPLPRLSYQLRFVDIPYDGFGEDFRFSSDAYDYEDAGGGFSLHGDFLEGWDEDVKRTWTKECIREGRNCGTDFLGDGRELY